LIQAQLRDAIFETGRSQVTISRGLKEDVLRFNLFPIAGKESIVSQLDQLIISVKTDPDVAASVSRKNLSLVTSNPISKQVDEKKLQSKTTETLGSITILRPTLKSLRFYTPGETVDGIVVENQKDTLGFTRSESLLVNFQDIGSISQPGPLASKISRSRSQKRCIPIELPLGVFIADNQQFLIQILGTQKQRTVCSQQISVTRPTVVGSLQTVQRIKSLNFTRVDRSKVRFAAYVDLFPTSERINFNYCIWSDSVRKSRSRSSVARIDPASRSAVIDIVCSEKEYVEVFATCLDSAGRVCSQPVRSLITPSYKEIDVACAILRSQDKDGISAELLGIPRDVSRVKIIRKNLDTHIETTLGAYPVANSQMIFKDDEITESNYPSLASRFSYSFYLEKAGSFIQSSHSLDVNFHLINDSYDFTPLFSRKSNTLSISMSPVLVSSPLDALSRDLNQKSLSDAYSDQIKQVRSQTDEKFLYDVISVSEVSGEQTYIGEFSDPDFSIQISDNISIFVLPKTTTPRQQIGAIKKLVEQPSLVSRSRISRVSPKSLASSLDSSVVTSDGVSPSILNQRSLIDGLISNSEASKVSNLTGHVYSYSSGRSQPVVPTYTSISAKRIEGQNNLVSWNCLSTVEFYYFMISVVTKDAIIDLMKVPKAIGSTRYQFIDPVYGRIPGKITYTITPVGFDDSRGTSVSATVDVEEVQIG
jgi:hypothetical protein